MLALLLLVFAYESAGSGHLNSSDSATATALALEAELEDDVALLQVVQIKTLSSSTGGLLEEKDHKDPPLRSHAELLQQPVVYPDWMYGLAWAWFPDLEENGTASSPGQNLAGLKHFADFVTDVSRLSYARVVGLCTGSSKLELARANATLQVSNQAHVPSRSVPSVWSQSLVAVTLLIMLGLACYMVFGRQGSRSTNVEPKGAWEHLRLLAFHLTNAIYGLFATAVVLGLPLLAGLLPVLRDGAKLTEHTGLIVLDLLGLGTAAAVLHLFLAAGVADRLADHDGRLARWALAPSRAGAQAWAEASIAPPSPGMRPSWCAFVHFLMKLPVTIFSVSIVLFLHGLSFFLISVAIVCATCPGKSDSATGAQACEPLRDRLADGLSSSILAQPIPLFLCGLLFALLGAFATRALAHGTAAATLCVVDMRESDFSSQDSDDD